MKIFLDTADYDVIKKWSSTCLIDGVTTNPSLLSKVPNTTLRTHIQKICGAMGERPVSVEVTERDPQAVYKQAHAIADIADNIVVKIPCFQENIDVIQKLINEEISLNITLVFSATQALFMAKLGVDYISPFIGRLDDIGSEGIQLIRDCAEIFEAYSYETEILAASIRSPRHIHEAALSGSDIVTVPISVLEKAFKHPLSDTGLDTFLADWKSTGITTFP